jgi:xanthine dehydrogenase accessory factor
VSAGVAELSRLAEAGTPAVLVTVLGTEGSSPREAGAKLVVTAEAFHGTVGGGRMEQVALEEARALLAALAEGRRPAGPVRRAYALGPALGQCCGGQVELLLELVAPPAWTVAVFGAGHVGRALVRLLADLPCRVLWVDPREAELPAEVPRNVRREVSDAPDEVAAALPEGCDVLVMTHSHALDQEVVEAVLRRARPRYLGLIGSQTKRARCLARLEAKGFDEATRARLTCPIGLPGVGGKAPAEIAIAVAAELLLLQGAPRPLPASP